MANSHDFDVLIVGSGLAGLSRRAAPGAHAPRGRAHQARAERRLQRAGPRAASPRCWAKATASQSHVDDTLVAGAGLCDLAATRFVVEHAPEAIDWLRELGVPFSRDERRTCT